jgi:hypothetical protein
VKPPGGDRGRQRRTTRLRTDWRRDEEASRASSTPPDADEDRRRQDDALSSNDAIRAEAPDDLETRRRADQLEREIKRSNRDDR